MRLNQDQVRLIVDAVSRWAGPGAEAYLFGSRLNDAVSGGDVDIFVEADTALSLIQRARIKMELESRLGLPVDIIAHVRNAALTPFQIIASGDAARLEV
ncbi:MAG: nucleotidyltransferase domain-containing protein [Gammaproteobacteria bacterium]|nr:nucleotidyltransferase domain-containing protein [Gammaproteobacteria bacterium]